MIRINLLGQGLAKEEMGRSRVRMAGVIFLGLSVILIGVGVLLNRQVSSLRQETAKLSHQAEALGAKRKEIETYEKTKKEVGEKINVISQIRKKQSIPVTILDGVVGSIPDPVWLTGLALQGEGLHLEGRAVASGDVFDFVNNLKKLPLFKDVKIIESRQLDGSGYYFKINGMIL